MKANEFVKRFGWEYAKERMEYCKGARLVGMEIDLERLVESHELVEKHGGLENAKDEYFSCVQNNEPASYIAKAIADVESCQ